MLYCRVIHGVYVIDQSNLLQSPFGLLWFLIYLLIMAQLGIILWTKKTAWPMFSWTCTQYGLNPNGILVSIIQFLSFFHRVQRLMLSKGAKRWIWDDITWFPKYFWQIIIARNEDINKDDTSIVNLFKKLLVSANTSVQLKQRKFK